MQWRIASIVLLLVCGFWNIERLIAAPAELQSGDAAISAEGVRYEHKLMV